MRRRPEVEVGFLGWMRMGRSGCGPDVAFHVAMADAPTRPDGSVRPAVPRPVAERTTARPYRLRPDGPGLDHSRRTAGRLEPVDRRTGCGRRHRCPIGRCGHVPDPQRARRPPVGLGIGKQYPLGNPSVAGRRDRHRQSVRRFGAQPGVGRRPGPARLAARRADDWGDLPGRHLHDRGHPRRTRPQPPC